MCCEIVLGAEVCVPCGLTWNDRKSIELVGWDIPANGQPIEDTLLEISSVEPNEAPEAVDSTVTTLEDTELRGTCGGTDANGDKMLFSLVHSDGPFKVEIVNPNTGAFKVVPATNRHESGFFVFQISDGSLKSLVGIVTVHLQAVADVPLVFGEALLGDEDQPIEIHFRVVSLDPDGSEEPSITIGDIPAKWSLLKNGVPQMMQSPYTETPHDTAIAGDSSFFDITTAQFAAARSMPERSPSCPQCKTVKFEPVCGADNVTTVFTPCEAVECGVGGGSTYIRHGYCAGGGDVYALRPPADFNGAFVVKLTGHATEKSNGNAASVSRTITGQLRSVNDKPVLMALRTEGVRLAEDENFGLAGVNVFDVDSATGSITVHIETTNGLPEVALGVAGVTYESQNGGSTIRVSGAAARVNQAIVSMLYRSVPNYHGNETLSMQVFDNGASGLGEWAASGSEEGWASRLSPLLNDSGTLAIEIYPVNDPPVVDIPGPASATEGEECVLADVSISDPDDDGGVMEITLTGKTTPKGLKFGEIFLGATQGGWKPSHTMSGTKKQLNAALAQLKYKPIHSAVCAHNVQVEVNDKGNSGFGGPLSSTRILGISLLMMNSPPTVAVNKPSVVGTEDTPLSFAGALQVADSDAGNGELKMTLSVAHGTLVVGTHPGVAVDGDMPARRIVVFASLDNQNWVLDHMTYVPNTHFKGSDVLSLIVNDQGNMGFSDSVLGIPDVAAQVTITISAVAKVPQIDVADIKENQNQEAMDVPIEITVTSDDPSEIFSVRVKLDLTCGGKSPTWGDCTMCNLNYVKVKMGTSVSNSDLTATTASEIASLKLALPVVTSTSECQVDVQVRAHAIDGSKSSGYVTVTKRVYVGGYNDDAECNLNGLVSRRRRQLKGGRQLAGPSFCPSCSWKFKDTCGKEKSKTRRRRDLGVVSPTKGSTTPAVGCTISDSCCCKDVVTVTGITEYCNGKTFSNSAALSDMYCGSTGGEQIKVRVTRGEHLGCRSYPPTESGQIKCKWVRAYTCSSSTNTGNEKYKTTTGTRYIKKISFWTGYYVICDTPDWGFNEVRQCKSIIDLNNPVHPVHPHTLIPPYFLFSV